MSLNLPTSRWLNVRGVTVDREAVQAVTRGDRLSAELHMLGGAVVSIPLYPISEAESDDPRVHRWPDCSVWDAESFADDRYPEVVRAITGEPERKPEAHNELRSATDGDFVAPPTRVRGP